MDDVQLREQAVVALQDGDLAGARARFRAASRCCASNSGLLRELAGSLWRLYDFEFALETYGRAAAVEPRSIEAHLLAAQKLFSIGRFQQSAAWLERALAAHPGDPSTLVMLAEVYERNNQLDGAEERALEALKGTPHDVRAVRLLAHLERRRGHFVEARQRLTTQLERFHGPEDWRLRYELASVLDRLGEYDSAMEQLLMAKRQLEPEARAHIPVAHAVRKRQWEVIEHLRRADFTAWRKLELPASRRISFLCGHPRSGTTLLEQILGAHPDIVTTDETGILVREYIEPIIRQPSSVLTVLEELRAFNPRQIEEGRATYLQFTEAHLGETVGARWLIEKDPGLTPDLPLPLRLFPEARVIFPMRDPRDVCVSYFFTMLPLNPVSVASLDLRSTCENCAHSFRSWQHWRDVLPYPWLEARYEDLVAEPQSEVRRVSDFLELPWTDRMLNFHERSESKGIRTPTYADVARPIYQRAVGRWRNYERHLAPHLGELRPWLRAFGYE